MNEDPRTLGSTRRIAVPGGWGHQITLPGVTIQRLAPGGKEEPRHFTLPRIRIGSDPACDIVLEDPTVSREHAEITLGPGGAVLTDLGSTNGTHVSGVQVREVVLREPVEIRLGACTLRIQPASRTRLALPAERSTLGGLVGRSPAMRELFGILEAVASSPVTVLVHGESGTGKELIARCLHELSGRSGPYVVFDCASTSPEMIRSELFGHGRGAFTGAEKERTGSFRLAQGGTLFIDEIGELPLDIQPVLLRCLEAREVRPLGSDRTEKIDVRVVAATHRDLAKAVREGKFREDLFHRLQVVPVQVPALRERREDIPLLMESLGRSIGLTCRFPPDTLDALVRMDWPGNVRGLRNLLERLQIFRKDADVTIEDLRRHAPGSPREAEAMAPTGGDDLHLESQERRLIEEAMRRHGGNLQEAAAALGISSKTLRRRLRGASGGPDEAS